jgi:hypothetical protein
MRNTPFSAEAATITSEISPYLCSETLAEVALTHLQLYEAERAYRAETAELDAALLLGEMRREIQRLQTLLQEYGNG